MKNYDEAYDKREYYWGHEPNSLCKSLLDLYPMKNAEQIEVLDLGCGEGRDSMFMARKGAKVTGVDISEPGLKKLNAVARSEDLPIITIRSDINGLELDSSYDAIYSSGTLTFLKKDVRNDAFNNFKSHTKKGGYNAFNAFVYEPSLGIPPDWGDDEFFFTSGELEEYYRDWKIVQYSENTFHCNSSGVAHMHAMETLIAGNIDR